VLSESSGDSQEVDSCPQDHSLYVETCDGAAAEPLEPQPRRFGILMNDVAGRRKQIPCAIRALLISLSTAGPSTSLCVQ